MEQTVIPYREAVRSRRIRWWRTTALVCAAVVLAVAALANYRPEEPLSSEDSVRLMLDCTVRSRQVYALRSYPSGHAAHALADERRLLDDFTRLSQINPSAGVLRRLAIMQYTLGDAAWKATLLRIRQLPSTSTPADAEHELALWRNVLEGHPGPAEAERIRARIQEMELGWFQHLALETLYARSGMLKEARKEKEAAQRSSARLAAASSFGWGISLLGLLIGLFAARTLWVKYRDPYAPLPAVLTPAPPPALDRRQGNALYIVFLVYMVSLAAVRMMAPWAVSWLVDDPSYSLSAIQTILLTIGVSVLSMVPACLVFLSLSPRAGLSVRDIGFRTANLRLDVLWGVAGFMVALPLVAAANWVSSWLFQGIKSPTHPALVELAAGNNLLLQVLLLLQAVLLAPVLEETVFRGVFFRGLSPRTGRTWALVLTSGVFAILHPQLPLGFLGLFVLGATFNVLYQFRGSLLPSMVAHALNNGAILVFFTLLVGE
jgi:membrane protease YdiL (CAAX protease family)